MDGDPIRERDSLIQGERSFAGGEYTKKKGSEKGEIQ